MPKKGQPQEPAERDTLDNIIKHLPGSAKGPVTQSGKVDRRDDKKDDAKDQSS